MQIITLNNVWYEYKQYTDADARFYERDRIIRENKAKGIKLSKEEIDKQVEECIKNQNREFALKDISFNVNEGEFVAIVGRNGSGKSTLAKLLNALFVPTSGKVVVFDKDTSDFKNALEIRKNVGMVFQNPDNQMVASIVEDDIAFGAENIGLSREVIGERIDFALKSVDMEKFRHSTPEKLSGGQKQRIAIAGMLALMPKVLVLDESTAMLDPVGRKEVLEVVKELNEKYKMTVILITHFMEEVVSCDRVFVLNDGSLLTEGTPVEIFNNDEVLKKAGLELPSAVKVAKILRQNGVEIADNILEKEELVERLCQLL